MWQKNSYKFEYLRKTKDSGIKLNALINLIIQLFLIAVYVVVIFNDGLTFRYQLAVGFTLIAEASLFIREIYLSSFVRPVFSIKALSICLLSFLFILFLYSNPLIDNYLWFVILLFLTPAIVAIFVWLFAFPTEIYEDIIIQKTIEKIKKNKKILMVSILSENEENVFGNLKKSLTENRYNLISILKTFNNINDSTNLFVFRVSIEREKERIKLFELFRPDFVVLGKLSFVKSDKKVLEKYKQLLRGCPREAVVLLSAGDKDKKSILKKIWKKVIVYETRKELKDLISRH